MSTTFLIETAKNFSFPHTIFSHGWSDLLPFIVDEENQVLKYTFSSVKKEKPVTATITAEKGGLRVELSRTPKDFERILSGIRHILRFDDGLEEFYELSYGRESFHWIVETNAGRLLRSATVFEDLVKTLCTTNCSWGLTKNMVTNLVETLGETGTKGHKAFPTASALASQTEAFYRNEIRAGYRSPYFVELGERVASSEIDPESWLDSELPSDELKKEIKQIKGVGNYAAENMLKLLGRYDGLALDSWLRAQFYKKHNSQKTCTDKKIEKHYKAFGKWKGLAIWCDMTQEWFDDLKIK